MSPVFGFLFIVGLIASIIVGVTWVWALDSMGGNKGPETIKEIKHLAYRIWICTLISGVLMVAILSN